MHFREMRSTSSRVNGKLQFLSMWIHIHLFVYAFEGEKILQCITPWSRQHLMGCFSHFTAPSHSQPSAVVPVVWITLLWALVAFSTDSQDLWDTENLAQRNALLLSPWHAKAVCACLGMTRQAGPSRKFCFSNCKKSRGPLQKAGWDTSKNFTVHSLHSFTARETWKLTTSCRSSIHLYKIAICWKKWK